MCRLPEWSMSHTPPSVSKQTSMKWLPPPKVPSWLAVLYCVSFFGPLYHVLRGWLHDDDARWWWHLPTCYGSVIGTLWGYATHFRRRGEKKSIADLQVEQKLKRG